MSTPLPATDRMTLVAFLTVEAEAGGRHEVVGIGLTVAMRDPYDGMEYLR